LSPQGIGFEKPTKAKDSKAENRKLLMLAKSGRTLANNDFPYRFMETCKSRII
jgi:hypothetical protein